MRVPTDAKDSDHAVVGGVLLNRIDIPEFGTARNAMLTCYHMSSGLHMIALGQKGPYPELIGDRCAAMLAEAVRIINKARIFTFAVTSNNRQHETLFSSDLRQKIFSVYAPAFLMTVEINRASAARAQYKGAVDFVFDDGNQFKRHLVALHDSIR